MSADSLARVRAWLEAQRSGGGTDLAGALQRVVPWVAAEAAEEVAELVVVTDGRPNGYTIGSERLEDWVARQARVTGDRLRVHTVGIGHDVDAPLLRELAHETGGRAVFALDDAEVVGLVRATFAEVGPGGLSDPTLAVWGEGLAGVVTSARGAVRHGERIELGARVDGAETLHVRLTATLPDDCAYEAEWTLDVPAPDGGLGGLTVPPLYGRLRAARTYRAMEDAGETDDLLLAAALVLRRFGLVGRYSGYLGLESEALYAERGIRRVERDPADVALDDLADTALPAGRIGGEGALDGHQADPWADPAGAGAVSADYERSGAALDAGCGCSAGASGAAASAPLLLLLGLSVLALRVLRRGMSD